MHIKDRRWSPIEIEKIFTIAATKSSIDRVKLIPGDGNYPYITRTDKNNGWDGFVCVQQQYGLDGGNVVSVGLDTQTVFYQPTKFYTGQNIQILSSPHMTKYVAMFLLPLLKVQLRKFNWGGNGATLTRMRKLRMVVPVDQHGNPDYGFMDSYMRHVEWRMLENYAKENAVRFKKANRALSFSSIQWGDFAVTDLFRIESGKRLESYKMDPGTLPFIGAADSGNGVTQFISNTNESLDRNVLGVNYNGNGMGIGFYHPYEALFSDDVKRFHLKQIPDDKYVFLFLKAAILKQKPKFDYGYKFNAERMARQRLVLPKAADGRPDYDFMRQFMMNAEAKLRRRYAEARLKGL